MNSVKIKAYAKVNLTLEIVGVKDGYHLLDSLVASVNLYDLVTLKKRKDKLCSVQMRGLDSERIPPEQNNALKAAEMFVNEFSTCGADITVYRNIPVGAGLGSSSADISGVLTGMAKLYGVEKSKTYPLAERLGSDTRYMMDGGFARMQGRGELVTKIKTEETLHFLLICPKSGVSAGACYHQFDKLGGSTEPKTATQNAIDALIKKDINGLGRYLTNDLYAPAVSLSKDVEEGYLAATSFSPIGAVMTGSGSCSLAMFENEEFCRWAQSRYKGKAKTYVVKTVIPEKKKGWRNPFKVSEDEMEACE